MSGEHLGDGAAEVAGDLARLDVHQAAADAAWAFGRAVGSGGTQRLAWAEVAARRAEVDRAALTQPLPAAAEGAARTAGGPKMPRASVTRS